jgi:hypothetical protein
MQIKVALAHPTASNGVCSRHRSGYNLITQNQIFSFAYMLLFLSGLPDFEGSNLPLSRFEQFYKLLQD